MSNSLILFSYINPVSCIILLQIAIGGCIGGLSLLYYKITIGLRLTIAPIASSVGKVESQIRNRTLVDGARSTSIIATSSGARRATWTRPSAP